MSEESGTTKLVDDDRNERGRRANFVGAPALYNLNLQARVLVEAFGWCVYLVGSSIYRRDFRDVDVRVMLDDAEFDRLFPSAHGSWNHNGLWTLMCASISEFLKARTNLPIDFQIQRMTEANAEYSRKHGNERQPLGVFLRDHGDPKSTVTKSEAFPLEPLPPPRTAES